jgi:hypothetical protein
VPSNAVFTQGSNLSDRRAASEDFDRRHPHGRFDNLVSLGTEGKLLEGTGRQPDRIVTVEYFSCPGRRLLEPVAVRVDGGPIEMLAQPGPPPPSKPTGYMIPRRRRARSGRVA